MSQKQDQGKQDDEIEIPASKPPVDQGQQQPINNPPQSPQQQVDGEDEGSHASDDEGDPPVDGAKGAQQPLLVKKKNTYQHMKSIQQQQTDLEQNNRNALAWAIRLRSFWRMLNLLIITTLLFTGFSYIYLYFARYEGTDFLPSNANILMNVTNCKIVIQDQLAPQSNGAKSGSSSNPFGRRLLHDYKHLNDTNQSSSSSSSSSSSNQTISSGSISMDDAIQVSYTIPGRFNIDPEMTTSSMQKAVNGSNYSFEFVNILSPESCQITVNVLKQTTINNLQIACSQSCYIMMLTESITFNTINITSDAYIEFNAPTITTKNITFQGIQGRFQSMYLDFEVFADIRLESGDIAIQTNKEMMLNFTHANPNFCMAAPTVANPIIIGCQAPPAAEVQAYITGIGSGGTPANTSAKGNSTATNKTANSTGSSAGSTSSASSPKEKFFIDGQSDGNVILLPGFKTYSRSKVFQHQVVANVTSSGSGNLSANGTHPTTNSTANGTFSAKTNAQKQQQQLLFQPNCFGNIILCLTDECASLKAGLSKLNESKLNISAPAGPAVPSNTTGAVPNASIPKNRMLTKEGRFFMRRGDEIHDRLLIQKHYATVVPAASSASSTPSGASSGVKPANVSTNSSANATQPVNTTAQSQAAESEAETELPHQIPQGIPFLNLTGRFGNLYVNIIPAPNGTVHSNDTIVHGSNYANSTIDLDIPSQKIMAQYLTMAADPHNFDPTFIMQIGAKTTQSNNFQQWQVTFNPAYAYIRPWWIGTFSFTLMSTATWNMQLNLGPGFCPYYPILNLDDVFNTGFMIDSKFTKLSEAAHQISTIAWQHQVPFPPKLVTPNDTLNGIRQVITSNNEKESWVQVQKLNETAFSTIDISLGQSPATMFAVYISITIAVLMGGFLIIAVVYAINQVYSQIITQVSSTTTYSKIEKKEDSGSAQPLMKYTPEADKKVTKAVNGDDDDEDEKKKQAAEAAEAKKKQSGNIEISLSYNPGRLFYQLFVLAPPMSAFIDYLCVLLTKKYINSAHEFYTHLFHEVEKSDSDDSSGLHDLTTESMLGNDMKTLYEKFCYLNGFLEQKLDDPANIKLLKDKGFKIEERSDAQTESYVCVMLNGEMPKLSQVPHNKNSLQLFIESCCTLSTFDQDNVVVQTFTENYEQFLTLNHLSKYTTTAAEMQKLFNITSKYIPQQWVVRDDSTIAKVNPDTTNQSFMQKMTASINSCTRKLTPNSANFIIDRQKMQNHFSLILQHPEKIATPEELALANKELILFGGWYIVDSITVVAHLLTTFILITPAFAFTLLERVLYSPFSLIPEQYIITQEDVTENYWQLPIKLYNESTPIKIILMLVGVYWSYSIIDLIYYYISMEFPQENFFRKVQPQTANFFQRLFRRTMWTLVLISAYQLCVYIALATVWLMLGAIVNPTAFLPYATGAATFVAVVSAKAAQFKEISDNGFQKVITYVQNIASQQMSGMMKKMNLGGKMDAVMDSGTFKDIAGKAAEMGLVDPATLAHLQENADQMLANPEKAAEQVGGDLAKIASDPGAFAAAMMEKMEQKALTLIQEQMAKQIEGFGPQLANIVLAIFKKDQTLFKNNMTQLIYAASKVVNIPELQKMGTPVINLVWEFAYPTTTGTEKLEDYVQKFTQPTVDCLSGLVVQELKDLNIDMKKLPVAITNSISLYRDLTKKQYTAVYGDFEQILGGLDSPQFPELQELKKYSSLLKVSMSLFDETGISFHNVFKIIKGFVEAIPSMEPFKDLLGMLELLVNVFRKQQKVVPTKVLRSKVNKAMTFLQNQLKNNKVQLSKPEMKLLNNPSVITLFFNFLQCHFDKVPKDMLIDIFKYALDGSSIKKMVSSDKEMKKLSKLMSGVMELTSLFMEDHHELTTQLHTQAMAFSIPDEKAKQLNDVFSFKYLGYTTYEGSPKEEAAYKALEGNPLVEQITSKLRISNKVVLGVLSLLMGQHSRSGTQDLHQMISKISNCDPMKVKLFFQILILYTSNNETHLANAAILLGIPREYISLILISKRVLQPIFVSDQSLQFLGAKDSINTRQEYMNEKDQKAWIESLTTEIVQTDEELVPGGNTPNLKRFLLLNISQGGSQMTKGVVLTALKSLGNNQNQFAKLAQNDIDLLQKILMLKNIDLFSNTGSLSSDTKQAIYEFATILNVSKTTMEDFINIFFLTVPDRVCSSIINVGETPEKAFFTEDVIRNYEEYLEYAFSHQERIPKKRDMIVNRFSDILPFVKLPKAFVLKLIFNKDQQIDINSFYQLAFMVIGKVKRQTGKNEESEVLPKETIPSLNKVVAFLTSTLNSSTLDTLKKQLDVRDEDGNPKEISDGQATLVSMLNENSRKRAITLLLDYIQNNTKKNKNDDQRYLPQVFHLFSVLYLFFTGQETSIPITVTEDGKAPKTYSIIQYLAKATDIKQEFFESLHSYYLQDNQKFTTVMVKYMRRNEACDFETKNPGVKIPLQSLVKIPDPFVLNFLNLIDGEAYSTSFFSRELGLDNTLVDMVAMIMKLLNPDASPQDKLAQLSMLSSNNSQVSQLLQKLGIKGDELSNLLLLMLQQYDITNVDPILKGLSLKNAVEKDVRALLQIDNVIPLDKDNKTTWKALDELITPNTIIKDMGFSNIEDVITTKALIQGAFTLTSEVLKNKWPHLQYPDCAPKRKDYTSLMISLVGTISGVIPSNDFNTSQFCRDLYQKLKVKQTPESKALMPAKNRVEYAYYHLTRLTQVDPWWLMLTQGIPQVWIDLKQYYGTITDQENDFLNPVLVLQVILTIQALPPLHKELFTELEWMQQTIKLAADENFQKYLGRANMNVDPYWSETGIAEEVQSIKNHVFGSLLETVNQMQDAANVIGINPIVFKILAVTDEDIPPIYTAVIPQIIKEWIPEMKEEDQEYFQQIVDKMLNEPSVINKDQNMSYEEAVKEVFMYNQEILPLFLSKIALIHERLLLRVFKEVQMLFLDPRPDEPQYTTTLTSDNVEQYISYKYYSPPDMPYFNLSLCTSLSVLRRAYWECGYNLPRGDDDHYKVVTTHLDYVLTSIERVYHFRGFMDFFSKARAFQLIGLTTGCPITMEHMINANCTAPFVNYYRANELYEMLNQRPPPATTQEMTLQIQKWKWNFLFDKVLANRNQSVEWQSRYFHLYKIDVKSEEELAVVEIENELENFINNSVQVINQYSWDDYIFDTAALPLTTDLSKIASYNNQNVRDIQAANKTLREAADLRRFLISQYVADNFKGQMSRDFEDKTAANKLLIEQQNAKPVLRGQPKPEPPPPVVLQKPTFLTTVDVRSGVKWSDVFQQQERWYEIANDDSYKILVDIFKGNYESIQESDTYFTDNMPSQVQLLFGLTALNGAYFKVQRGWIKNQSNDLSQYLNSCCFSTTSNKKNMAELLQIFMGCYYTMPQLASVTSSDQKLLDAFVSLSCKLGHTDEENRKYLSIIIQQLTLSNKDRDVLINLINTYLGDQQMYYKLAEYSSFITKKKVTKFKPIQLTNLMGKPRLPKGVRAPPKPKQKEEVPPPLAKNDSKGKDSKKDSKNAVKGLMVKKPAKKKKVEEVKNTETKYFNIKKLINKILYGFDQSLMHKLPKVDPERFDFIKYSNLSIDIEENENQFLTVLWQLATSLTRDTIDDNMMLPLISETDVQMKGDTTVKEFQDKLPYVQSCWKVITNLIKDDYSFFFEQDDKLKEVLQSLRLISSDDDLEFLQAMIGLKSSKMSSLEHRRSQARKEQKDKDRAEEKIQKAKQKSDLQGEIPNKGAESPGKKSRKSLMNKGQQQGVAQFDENDIEFQAHNLMKAKIVQIKIDGASADDNEATTERVAKLFLALSSGDMTKVVESLTEKDPMSAAFVMALSTWKRITQIFENLQNIEEYDYTEKIMPALLMLPLLIYSTINENQDKSKAVLKNKQRNDIQNSIGILVKQMHTFPISNWVFEDLHQWQKTNKSQRFSWALWINNLEQFGGMVRTQLTELKLPIQAELEYLLNFMTGKFLIDRFSQTSFLSYIINLYRIGNDLINLPDNLIKRNPPLTDIKKISTFLPSIATELQSYFPPAITSYLTIFDKFIQLFVFIQIPQTSLNLLAQANKKATQPSNSLNQSVVQEDDDQQQGEGEDGKQADQAAGSDGGSEYDKVIKQLLLEVLKSTIDSLMDSFYKEAQVKQAAQAEKDKAAAAEAAAKQPPQQQQGRQIQTPQQQLQQSQVQPGSAVGGFQGSIGPQATPLGTSSGPGATGVLAAPGAPGAPGAPVQSQVVLAAPPPAQTQMAQADYEKFMKALIYAVIQLLTGYDISDSKNISESSIEKKLGLLCQILDCTLFKQFNLLPYINSEVIKKFITVLEALANQSIKSISNKDFMAQITNLLYLISGQDNMVKEGEEHKVKTVAKRAVTSSSNPLSVKLPPAKPLVTLPMPIITCMFDMSQWSLDGVPEMLKYLKMRDGQVKIVENIINQVESMGVFGGKPAIQSSAPKAPTGDLADLMKKIAAGTATNADMFKAVNTDNSPGISKTEYGTVARRLGMNLSAHRINEIFASIKQGPNADDQLNEAEFGKAMQYLQNKNTDMALDFLGISPALLTISLIFLAIVLLLIFVFIFLGIQAFALGGTFGAVINSMLPMAAGGGAGSGGKKTDDKTKDDTVGESVAKTQTIIQSDKI